MPRVVFAGLRKDFLTAQLEDYEKALTDGARDDFVNDVLRRFLKRFPLDLPLDKEPSQEHLNAVDDSAPDEEPVLPEALPSGEAEPLYNAAMEKYEAEVSLIETRRAQIARWLKYHLAKKNGVQKTIDPMDPSTIFASRLLGIDIAKPRKIGAFHLYQRAKAELINALYEAAKKGLLPAEASSAATQQGGQAATADSSSQAEPSPSASGPSPPTRTTASRTTSKIGKKGRGGKGPGRVDIASRSTIALDLWKKEAQAVRNDFEARATAEHEAAVAAHEEELSAPPSTLPEDRQACIDRIASVIQPVLNSVAAYTGMKTSLIMGGPEPADGGQINIISLHAGSIRGPVKMNFAQAEREEYNDKVVRTFSAFLAKCYTRDDIRRAALPNAKSALSFLSDNVISYCSASGEDKLNPAGNDGASVTSPAPSSENSSEPPLPSAQSSPPSPSQDSPTSSPSSSETLPSCPSSASNATAEPSTSSASSATSSLPETSSTPSDAASSASPGGATKSARMDDNSPLDGRDQDDEVDYGALPPSHGSGSLDTGTRVLRSSNQRASSPTGAFVARQPSLPPPPSSPLWTPEPTPFSEARSQAAASPPSQIPPTLSQPCDPASATSPLPTNIRIGPPRSKRASNNGSVPGQRLAAVATDSGNVSSPAIAAPIAAPFTLSDLNAQHQTSASEVSGSGGTKKRPSGESIEKQKSSKRRRKGEKENASSGCADGGSKEKARDGGQNVGTGGSQREEGSSGGKKTRKRKTSEAVDNPGEVGRSTLCTSSQDMPSPPKRPKASPTHGEPLSSSASSSTGTPAPSMAVEQAVSLPTAVTTPLSSLVPSPTPVTTPSSSLVPSPTPVTTPSSSLVPSPTPVTTPPSSFVLSPTPVTTPPSSLVPSPTPVTTPSSSFAPSPAPGATPPSPGATPSSLATSSTPGATPSSLATSSTPGATPSSLATSSTQGGATPSSLATSSTPGATPSLLATSSTPGATLSFTAPQATASASTISTPPTTEVFYTPQGMSQEPPTIAPSSQVPSPAPAPSSVSPDPALAPASPACVSPSPSPPPPSTPSLTMSSQTLSPPVDSSPSSTPLSTALADVIRQIPRDCDGALSQTLKLVATASLGNEFNNLVLDWLRFEATYEYKGLEGKSSSRLSAKHRPPPVGDWIQRARVSTYKPTIAPSEFGSDFWAWWAHLQPPWRKVDKNTMSREVGGCWDALDKPSSNGWPSVVAALFFWGRAFAEREVDSESWLNWRMAVQDASWVLVQLRSQRGL
ncbi:hypothetical protein CVT26_009776 [Gymnopilus dilepis]|uniref:Uncharacterized protein n=1 Tax=Gymnopilus dilepis TaxID=231916 RepID=A0A409YIS5_9AGAR|nr:hypothetical protein CVT26_009776 [Gymnopilus dilepis]